MLLKLKKYGILKIKTMISSIKNIFSNIFQKKQNAVNLDLKDKFIKADISPKLIEEIFTEKKLSEKEDIKNYLNSLNKSANIPNKGVMIFVGINGSGKTTAVGKLAYYLKQNGHKPLLIAADTFRAAAIDQLQTHADKLDVKLIKHDYGSDAAAVAFDAIKHAEAKGIDIVLIDTAGRIHSNVNLMDEMSKIIRVAKPDLKIFVGESITGNDCTEQAKKFNETIGIDGIVLSKADIDEKGGAAISVSHITKKPILFLGTGQEYEDLKAFDKSIILNNLGL